ncbi:MAG: HD family phosphohydrolase [Spirochaetota bacterium]|jgi:putative nucleotidyltransferase with HDIG domain|uniref:HD family phosphohydrolase n=1 Tax=Rectinema subterraneum TaxID=2653714 RepID=UPI003BC99E2C
MKKNNDELFFSSLLRQLASMAPSMWYFLAAIVIAAVGLVFLGPSALGSRNSLRSIQPGKVADSDVYAGKDTVYVDKEATQRKILAEERLVLAVFVLDDKITSAVREKAEAFASYYRQLAGEPGGVDALSLLLRSRFPDLFQPELYTVLVRAKLNAQAFVYVSDIVESMLGKGVVSLPDGVFDQFNPNYYELVRTLGTRQESEQLPVNGMITLANLGNRLDDEMDARHVPESMKQYVRLLGKALLRENVFFDQGLSEKRIAAARARVEPVTRFVSRNEILVRKGELVTPELYQQIKTIRSAILVSDVGVLMTGLGLLLVASLLGFLLARVKDLSDFPSDRSSLLFLLSSLLILLYWILVIQNVIDSKSLSRGALFVPASLFAGLVSLLYGPRTGIFFSLISFFLTGAATNLNAQFMIGILLAGISATLTMRTARTRIMLARAAIFQAIIQALLAIILLLNQKPNAAELIQSMGLGALNGFAGGSFILLLLPLFERLLDRATQFRLMELADINAPILKEMLSNAPGTYAHSIQVAHLAEAAAKDIGANPLLARIGAYYHDIGKIEHPEYFTENQKGINRHDDINPSLSASIIRRHVKDGVERGREIGLPKEVIEIIGQHHGNSVMEAIISKVKDSVSEADVQSFSYQGEHPKSKEAAIVMLADTVEAASRSLKNPSSAKLEQFVHQLILHKLNTGQLEDSELTMRDIRITEEAFSRILQSQMHTRIEYPGQEQQ